MIDIRFRAVALATIVAALSGCDGNPRTGTVRGTVTYRGKPVPNGTVSFIPDAGPSATGELKPDGSYALTTYRGGDGAVPGKYRVIVVAMQDMADRLPEDRNPLPPPIVPLRYTSLATSDLRAEIAAGENTVNFELTDEKK